MFSPVAPYAQTFVHEFGYDSWHRIQSMTYPGGEVVNYSYDKGGNLKSMASAEVTYIAEIGYDHYEQKVYCKYGNGAENHYTYSPDLRRLSNLQSLTGGSLPMRDNTYTFDLVGNILSIDNTAAPVNGLGGG